GGFTNPISTYSHNGQSAAITGGAFYRTSQFPASYVGGYFFSDYILGFIRFMDTNNQVTDFQTGKPGPVDLKVGPDGSLYYLSITQGKVFKIQYGSGAPPTSACDVNGDNATNVVDVQLSVNQALGIGGCTADINKDGLCNVIDVQRIVNAALGGQCVS